MKTEKSISEMQLKVLNVLAEVYGHDCDCLYIRHIAKETGLDYRQARLAVRALARKGYAQYVRGLFDFDGMVAGSGYQCTYEGALIVKKCKNPVCKNLQDMITGECQHCWEKRRIYQFTEDWSDYKKGDTIKASDLGDGVIFKDLYFGNEKNSFKDKKIVDVTPDEYEYTV